MKKALYLVLKTTNQTFATLEEIKSMGYNATLISSESLRHAIEFLPEEQHFFTLRHFEKSINTESIFCLFIVDQEKIEDIKRVVRKNTNNFKDITGFMYSIDLIDFEGSMK